MYPKVKPSTWVPAGLVKITLLTIWREALLAKVRIVAWLILDQDGNDENRFVDCLYWIMVVYDLHLANGTSFPALKTSALIGGYPNIVAYLKRVEASPPSRKCANFARNLSALNVVP